VVGKVGVVATGRHFAAEAGMRMLARGGNAVDAGVAATFAAAVSEISHFGLGGEVPIILYLADKREVVVISGQGTAPAHASRQVFGRSIPTNGPSAGTVPAVVDALAIALAEFGTRSLAEVLAPAIDLADGFAWYEFLTAYLKPELAKMALFPSGARAYLQGPGRTIPAVGSLFRQPELAGTLRALADEEQRHLAEGRKAAIYAARDRFYRGDIGQRLAAAVQDGEQRRRREDRDQVEEVLAAVGVLALAPQPEHARLVPEDLPLEHARDDPLDQGAAQGTEGGHGLDPAQPFVAADPTLLEDQSQ
jgi:gamma-glutamyltranspeptidase/glutathione hydrolase